MVDANYLQTARHNQPVDEEPSEEHHMGSDDDAPWPPDDISDMLAEMCSDHTSLHWQRVRLLVHAFARRFGERSSTYLDDADDLTQQVMEILVTPGKLETFGRASAAGSISADGQRPPLRKAFLAWIAIVTRHAWQNRARYYR